MLDLDHTLVNSARFLEIDADHEQLLQTRMEHEQKLLPEGRQLHRLDHIQMWTKLRPGVRDFLTQAKEYFELWIHTNGNRSV